MTCLCGAELTPDLMELPSGEIVEVPAELCEECDRVWYERELEEVK